MLAAERRQLILVKIHEDKRVIVSELSRQFEVSEETIRRDLDRLEEDGHVTKSYGGAVLNEKSGIDLPFNVREQENSEGKKLIADLVAGLLEEGDHIFLDASTTAVFIAKTIKNKGKMTVITNSIENVLELSDAQDIEVISTGGVLKPDSMALMGRKAADVVEAYNADRVILSCKGFDMDKGATDGNEDIAGIKQNMIRSASQVIMAVDYTKFDKIAFANICSLSDIDIVITDKKPGEKWLNYFKQNEVKCIYP